MRDNNVGVQGGLMYSFCLNVCHVNVNSLLNKINELNLFLLGKNVDILGISESWLSGDIPDFHRYYWL